jgi:small conductance mechanosensitive channel
MYKLTALAIPKLVEKYIQIRAKGRHSKIWYHNRSQTLSTVMITTLGALILVIAVFTVLSEIGIDITPLLAGAGVAGIAIGFGAQNLIKDLLSGLFILLEDQYNKGDVVEVAGREGTVEEINLRRTVLRDLDGVVYSIPNGEISTTSNYTRDWSRVKLDVPVGYGEDLDRVFEVLNQVGKDLAADKAFSSKIKTPPQVLRVQRFSDSSVDVRMLGDVKPSEQWTVTGELRKRVKKAFDEQGIEIPRPHVKVYFGQGQGSKTVAACPHCSKPTDTTALFCSNCGAALVPGEDKKPGV